MTDEPAGSPPPRWFLKAFSSVHTCLYRLFGGRAFHRLGRWDMCLVTMTGARSGRRRTLPLMWVPDGEAALLVASQGGAPRHPQWYHNLVAHPEVEIEQGGRRSRLRARLLAGDERARAWRVCVEHYPPYEQYQRRTDREIPVFRCEPA
ncbi:MAG: nitroreductase family deazaflavin-dependent oxidoreductase [Thermoanaerobaculia bacterium]|nr:nitroreductase family deazaflavin-dependent oxidoreductase [Thermoanaerobaculia bacterium]